MNNDNNDNRRDRGSSNRFILCILLMYLLININEDGKYDDTKYTQAKQKVQNTNLPKPKIEQLFRLFKESQYVGTWTNLDKSKTKLLQHQDGKFQMKISRSRLNDQTIHSLHITVNDGQYIDDGVIEMFKIIDPLSFQSIRNEGGVSIQLKQHQKRNTTIQNATTQNPIKNNSSNLNSSHQNTQMNQVSIAIEQNLLLQTLNHTNVNLSKFNINFHVDNSTSQLFTTLNIEIQELNINLTVTHHLQNLFSTILFAVILSIIAFVEITAVMEIYSSVFQGESSLVYYSVITMLICSLWDGALSIFSFLQAFTDNNLILFIAPSFICLIMFMNLELRLILMIIQARSENGSIQSILCKFNLLTYGSMLLVYPILYYTNLSAYLFIALSLILFPQIVVNGQQSHRPNLYSPYYKQFVPIRYLLFFYLKCYPWNLYELRPNFLLGLCMVTLLTIQYGLLFAQALYGPRKVLPRFLLPHIYNYKYELEQNVEQGKQTDQQCAICLCNLKQKPVEIKLDFEVSHQVMKSPCGHKYHGPCLIKWMQIKMECPQCRAKLPPFQ